MKEINSWIGKIHCGDCVEVMKSFPEHSIDAVITDVPYNLGEHTSGLIKFKNRENMNKANVDEWNKGFEPLAFLPEIKRVLKSTGNIFIYCSHRQFGSYLDWLQENFDKTFFGVWHKTNPVPQVRKVAFLSSCELWVSAWNNHHKWNFGKQNDMHNFIECGICQGRERKAHTGQKPLKAMHKLIEVSTDENDIILDPFVGTGTTCVAAKELGRKWIGIEISLEYCQIASARLENCEIVRHATYKPVEATMETKREPQKGACGYAGNCSYKDSDGNCTYTHDCKEKRK